MAVNKDSKCSVLEYKCVICLQLLIEPVVLPCKHEMCRPCFRKNVEEANFVCPMCRRRIASWARKRIREGTLVDQNRWNIIQKLFPKKCLKRLQGDDDDSEDEADQPPPKRILAKSGELRQEYEEEMNKILQVQEKEEQASRDLIKNILEEERALQLQQEKEDEELARKLSGEQTPGSKEGSSELVKNQSKTGDVTTNMNSKDLKKKKARTKCRKSYTLDKYFFPKNNDSGNSFPSNPSVSHEQQDEGDYDLALALQKKFDHEAVAANKRDEYMLRKSKPDKNCSKTTEKNGHEKLGEQKNGHSYTRREQIRDKILVQVNGDDTLSIDEKQVANPQIQRNEMRNLRDRTV